MKKQLAIWQLIHSSLRSHTPVMLLYVLQSSGSSPGRQGFFMAVNKNGGMEGSIGGGIMEHKFVEFAKQLLQSKANSDTASLIRKQVHDKSAANHQSGMICSGEQLNFLYRVQLKDFSNVAAIMLCLQQQDDGWLSLSPDGFSFSQGSAGVEPATSFNFVDEQNWRYTERIGYRNTVFIIGGGHCSLAFSKLMLMMDFYIHVYDTRQDLHTLSINHYAHEKHILNDYSELKELIPPGLHHFVVVMTVGYRTDLIAISALATKPFKYLGVLGSKTKMSKLFEELEKAGTTKADLSRIHAPIGLPINSQTPEEIAISIAAEMIRVKNGTSDLTD